MSSIHVPEPRLGLDIGGVIIARSAHDSSDTSFFGGSLAAALATPPTEGMFEHVPVLVQRFGGAIWLVSKAGSRIQERTLRWLEHHKFFERTNISRAHVRFCRERPEKAAHCAELALSYFVDDRLDVLQHLDGVVPHRFLFGPQDRPVAENRITPVATWAEVTSKVMPKVLEKAARGKAR